MYDVVAIGGASFDALFKTDDVSISKHDGKEEIHCAYGSKIYSDDVSFSAGGGGCNGAVALSTLGLDTAILTRVGVDEQGHSLLRALETRGVDISHAQQDAKLATAFSFILSPRHHAANRTIFVHRGANDALELTSKELSELKTKWFFISSLGLKWEENLQAILKQPGAIAWNPSVKLIHSATKELLQYIGKLHVLSVNKEEALALANLDVECSVKEDQEDLVTELLYTLHRYGPDIVTITDGISGAWTYDGSETLHQEADANISVADATGAGDAFFSGLIAGLILYDDIRKAMKIGMANAQSVITKVGAQNGLLTREQVEKLL